MTQQVKPASFPRMMLSLIALSIASSAAVATALFVVDGIAELVSRAIA